MIVVRNVFQLKFGKAREMREAWNQWKEVGGTMGEVRGFRSLTDMTGTSYTWVFEIEFDSLSAYEKGQQSLFANPEWRAFYSKVLPLVESGSREIYNLEDSGTADTIKRAQAGLVGEPA